MPNNTNLFSRIAYHSVYVLLCLLLAALLLVVPGDFVRQVLLSNNQYINLILTAIVFVLTVLIVLFVYALRLYVTRTVLASIPKTWIPIEKGDVTKEVRKMITNSLGRSAAIARGARPKVITPASRPTSLENAAGDNGAVDSNAKEQRKSLQLFRPKPTATAEEQMGIAFPPLRPVWGEIEHDGWGSPSSPDLPNLQYSTVLSELPNLIEAKAVSQAPPDPASHTDPPTLDADAVALLQRSHTMTMRDYVMNLISLGVLPSSQNAFEFLDSYERARFSTRSLSETHFRQLMHLFAELLRAMQPLDAASIYESHDPDDGYSESDGHIDDDAPRDTTPTTPARSNSSSLSLSGSSTRSRARRPTLPARNSSTRTWHQYRTAPTTPRSKGASGGRGLSHSPSTNSGTSSFAQTRRPYYPTSQSSSSSLRSTSQASSVIRLATREDRGDLPYVLRVGEAY
ncbi:uncharacterized protein F4822DRAFT_270805 [Hypoxylon trugodes]|uniref:uncharacterized protein n=1 Tax=Hypoxylon trugodes TaxID=326681 RepID=UPI00218F482D|nr:uncharacterized protein F4822DRAFT_270805 [Hypoxylon trugodes]KAI1389146.1 hypothetical protein F4822DRAFT_270805 [Hypoxylon trugodes]